MALLLIPCGGPPPRPHPANHPRPGHDFHHLRPRCLPPIKPVQRIKGLASSQSDIAQHRHLVLQGQNRFVCRQPTALVNRSCHRAPVQLQRLVVFVLAFHLLTLLMLLISQKPSKRDEVFQSEVSCTTQYIGYCCSLWTLSARRSLNPKMNTFTRVQKLAARKPRRRRHC